jgi:hypothetical protein
VLQGVGPDAEDGRELAIVAAIAGKLGHDTTAVGQTVWAEAGWTRDGSADVIRAAAAFRHSA